MLNALQLSQPFPDMRYFFKMHNKEIQENVTFCYTTENLILGEASCLLGNALIDTRHPCAKSAVLSLTNKYGKGCEAQI